VDHIVICGHYDCEVIKHELSGKDLSGWQMQGLPTSLGISSKLITFRDVSKLDPSARRPSNIAQMSSEKSREQRLEETYVLEEADWLRSQTNVNKAIQDRGLKIHAFVYDKNKNSCARLVEE
jgi:carbonic anhydrase